MKQILMVIAVLASVSFMFAATITGTVTNQSTGAPVANAFVKFMMCVAPPADTTAAGCPGHPGGGHGQGHGGPGGHGGHGGNGTTPPVMIQALTDANGTYTIADVTAGTYNGTCGMQAYRPARVNNIVVPEEGTTVNFQLIPRNTHGGPGRTNLHF